MDASDFVVEQVIISVVPGVAMNVVELVRATDGVAPDEIDAVMDYAARVELFDSVYDPKNLFGFLLPTDASAIGRLTPPGSSRKKGFYFQCMIVKPETFFQTGANPTTLVHLALNTTRFALYDPKKQLRSFELREPFACVKQDDIKYATNGIGAKALATLVQALVENRRALFVSSYNAYLLLGAVFSLLPIHARRALSFSVGLTFRDEGETRLVGATISPSKTFPQRYAEGFDAYLDLRDVVKNGDARDLENPWAVYIERTLAKDSLASFYCKIVKESLEYPNRVASSTPEPSMTMEEVSLLGEKWLQNADASFESAEIIEPALEEDEDEFDEDSENAFVIETPWSQEESRRDGEDWKINSDWVNDYGDSYDAEADARFDEAEDDEDLVEDEIEELLDSAALEKGEALSFFEIARAIIAEADKRATADADPATQESEQKRSAAREREELNALFDRFFKPAPRNIAELPESNDEEATPIVRGLTLAPFAILSAEFPEQNVSLRTLDNLIAKTCERAPAAKSALVDFWREFVESQNENVVERARDAYLNKLYQTTRARDAEETSERVNRILGAFDVFDIIMN